MHGVIWLGWLWLNIQPRRLHAPCNQAFFQRFLIFTMVLSLLRLMGVLLLRLAAVTVARGAALTWVRLDEWVEGTEVATCALMGKNSTTA